jgi:hypothetical protein
VFGGGVKVSGTRWSMRVTRAPFRPCPPVFTGVFTGLITARVFFQVTARVFFQVGKFGPGCVRPHILDSSLAWHVQGALLPQAPAGCGVTLGPRSHPVCSTAGWCVLVTQQRLTPLLSVCAVCTGRAYRRKQPPAVVLPPARWSQ